MPSLASRSLRGPLSDRPQLLAPSRRVGQEGNGADLVERILVAELDEQQLRQIGTWPLWTAFLESGSLKSDWLECTDEIELLGALP